jgi:hypothetical protein
MKTLKLLALVAALSVGLTACLKDKSAEQKTEQTTMEQTTTTDQTAPAEGQPTEAPPADTGTTQSAE